MRRPGFFFFQAEDGIRDIGVTGVQTCALPILEEHLGNRVSADTISAITDRVLPEIKAWKSRMLDSVYPIVWMDAIHYKVTDERGCAVTRAIYNVLGIDREGHKELLGMYISRNEGANFWLSVLTDLQNRGVEDRSEEHTSELQSR